MAAQLIDLAHTATAGADVWGRYRPAIDWWAAIIGRPAPDPAIPGPSGPRANTAFIEWAMGLPLGWVTGPDVGWSYTRQTKALGNGVVPQQAAAALSALARFAGEATHT